MLNNSLFYGHPESLLLYLGLIIIFKVFATTATNGGGGCGGTFAPSLFLGCVGGFVFARLWNGYGLFGFSLPETNYALLGMAGVMSGVFHAPLTGVFLIAELTGGYDLFLPLMIVSVSSYLTIHAFESHSIYSMRLARKGELLTHHKDRSILTLMSLDAVIDRERPRLSPDMNLGQLVQVISKSKANNFAVCDRNGSLLGIINLQSIRNIIFRSELYRLYRAEQLMCPPLAVLSVTASMNSVMEQFQETDAAVLPVLDADKNFVGFVTKVRIYASYRQLMRDFPRNSGAFFTRIGADRKNGRPQCAMWTRRESNPRPNEETICFLHAYLRLGFRTRARPELPASVLSSESFIIAARPAPTIPDLSAPPVQDASGQELPG